MLSSIEALYGKFWLGEEEKEEDDIEKYDELSFSIEVGEKERGG
jgi:hypothetical protein